MKIPFAGGCTCGAIRYECTAEPIMMLKCHCRDCQHITGGGFAAAVLLPAQAFRLTKGELSYHFTPSLAGGNHKRGFCAQCGSRITGAEKQNEPSQVIGVLAGSLDDPSWFRAQMDIFTSDVQPWDHMDPAIRSTNSIRQSKERRSYERNKQQPSGQSRDADSSTGGGCLRGVC